MFHAKAENLTAARENFAASQKNLTASQKCFTVWHNPLVSPVGVTLGATYLEKMCTDFQIVKFQV